MLWNGTQVGLNQLVLRDVERCSQGSILVSLAFMPSRM